MPGTKLGILCLPSRVWVQRWARILETQVQISPLPWKLVGGPWDSLTSSQGCCEDKMATPMRVKNVTRSTRVIQKNQDPIWNETLAWYVDVSTLDSSSFIVLRLQDWGIDEYEDSAFGSVSVPLAGAIERPNNIITMEKMSLRDNEQTATGCLVSVKVILLPPEPKVVPSKRAALKKLLWCPVSTKDSVEEEPAGGQKPKADSAPAPGESGPPSTVKKELPNKKQFFQVRVFIIEARQLQGNNIRPVVKVTIANHVFRTRIKFGNTPFYNEMFVQNFQEMPSVLFDEFITIQALNSRALRSDSLIGVFKIEIGLVYQAPGHVLYSKWLSLYDPENLNAGLKGYVKVNLCVLGAGDHAPDTDKIKEDQDGEDNVLKSAAVPSRMATLQLSIYQAEDIPQMDKDTVNYLKTKDEDLNDGEDLVDPSVEVNFAGKTLRTRVVFGNANPAWNQKMSFPMQMPSMCDLIKISILDGDEYSNTIIVGTTFLSLSKISFSGSETDGNVSGFLPCFGPSFLPVYGSPREYMNVQDPFEELNNGIQEGAAYRGRILVELNTSMEVITNPMIEDIPGEMVNKIERFMSRHRFGLCAVFYSATMMDNIKELIQFEVSIGNYGNKFDGTCKPFASTTQYSQAVYDGTCYYYLPWYDTKPMVAVTSFWEDVCYRISCLNAMESMYKTLKQNLDELKTISSPKDPKVDVVWKKLQKELLEESKKPLPILDEQATATLLDQQLMKLRTRILQQLSKAAEKTNSRNPLKKLIVKAENWLLKIASIAQEPQISMPDAIIWMLCNEKRVAYARVKAQSIMFAKRGHRTNGALCGMTQTIFMQRILQSKEEDTDIPALLRVRMWLGRLADSPEFMTCCEGRILVFAETYENQKKSHGTWGTRNLQPHPSFSDITGEVRLAKDKFQQPKGWKWDSDWTIEPQRRLLLDVETNRNEVMEEVFENQTRHPARSWKPAPIPYTDVSGSPASPKEEIMCPPGWHFEEEWKVEVNRAVDDAGWEYGVGIPPIDIPGTWHAAEKTYHTHRRRRWFRKRYRDAQTETREEKMASFLRLHLDAKFGDEDSWEYAPLYGWKFHIRREPNDVFRRRCWRRKLTPVVAGRVAPIFLLEGSLGVEADNLEKKEGEAKEPGGNVSQAKVPKKTSSQNLLKIYTPLLFCVFRHPVYYQLRCYIYQGRDLTGSSNKSSADPFAYVSFLHMSQQTRTLSGTLHPSWDQTLIFEKILIYGDSRSIEKDPPLVVVEIFDLDPGGNLFMGRCFCTPTVCLDLLQYTVPRLSTHPITNGRKAAGRLLSTFELLLDKDDALGKQPPPAWKDGVFTIPKTIRPVLKLMAIEILAWGLRSMKTFNLLAVSSPSLTIQCGEDSIETPIIPNIHENPNFPINVYLMKLYLPVDEDYAPPIELKVNDHREFGYKPVVGQATIGSLTQYLCDPWEERKPHTLPFRAISKAKIKGKPSKTASKFWFWKKEKKEQEDATAEEEEVDWWSKYYATVGDLSKSGNYLDKGFDTMKIYNCELEEVPEFQGLQDFCQTFRLYRGKVKDESIEDPMVGGEFKGLFRIYPLPEDPNILPPPRQFQELPESFPLDCLVRIYIVRAFDLQPKDRNGLCDPYVWIKLGKQRMGDREAYIPNTLNPVFGRLYEIACTIPQEKDLTISLYDFDVLSPDEIIGDTIIDVENRLQSRFGANCGLPQSYCVSGPSKWRDQLTPCELLEHFARIKNVPLAEISEDGNKATFMDRTFLLSDFETKTPSHNYLGPPKERMALHLLRLCGLVPEHLETRPLYNSVLPGIEQGRIQMWIDVFPENLGEPGPPFDITPRKPKVYELRCIIWNTMDVDLEDTNVFGDRMSDIYVKGWLDGLEEDKQKTDVHYRSLAGEGNFNWRFVFTMEYLPMEQVCVLTKKQHFWSLDETMQKVPPKLIIQIWDNDKFSADDFLGVLELNLTSIPRPAKRPRDCTVKMLLEGSRDSSPFHRKKPKRISLFVQKNLRGWWPCIVFEEDKRRVSGKVEMSLELLTEKEAEERPAGKGREEPNMNPVLKPPERPETSFLWFTAPMKSVKYIVWQKSKWKIIMFFCFVLLALLFASFIYSAPVSPLLMGWEIWPTEELGT
ncbi:fer-1-like protein 5 isoform X2 [Paroedura picta]|uniref:fer-1-like protein 5 isoform X2 n=1 Tax=Paroedura picta TaxID=143630 RepID=UPI004055AA1B